MEQGSKEWLEARRCKLTASEFHIVTSGTTAAKERLVDRILKELSGYVFPEINARSLSHGKEYEDHAIGAYELHQLERGKDIEVDKCGLLVHPDYSFIGGSPDGLVGVDGLIEVKNPYNNENHRVTLITGMPAKHRPQCVGNIWVSGREWCDFISHDPHEPHIPNRLYVQRIYRDDDEIALLADQVLNFWDKHISRLEPVKSEDLLTTQIPTF